MRTRVKSFAVTCGVFCLQTFVASVAGAQTDAFPTQPPADLPARNFQPAPVLRETLPNGLKIVVQQNKRVPLVTVALGVRAGQSAVPANLPGLEEAVVTMIEEGTSKYDRKKINEAAKNLGGSVRISASRDFVIFTGSAMAKNTAPLLDLLAEVLLRPKMENDTLAGYLFTLDKRRELASQSVEGLAHNAFAKAVYGTQHPYGLVEATADTIKGINPEVVREFYEKNYRPNGAVLVVVGDVEPKAVVAMAQASFGKWKKVSVAPKKIADPKLEPWNRIYFVDRPKSVQSTVLIGNVILKVSDQDEAALSIANAIIGGKSDSRLFATIREKYGYAYAINSSLDFDALAGEFMVNVQCRTAVTVKAIKQILKEVADLSTTGVSEKELQAAKNYLSGQFVQSLESQAALASTFFAMELEKKPADYLTAYRTRINAVTVADVQRVAKKYLLPQRAAIVIVGDTDRFKDELGDVGYIQTAKSKESE